MHLGFSSFTTESLRPLCMLSHFSRVRALCNLWTLYSGYNFPPPAGLGHLPAPRPLGNLSL